MCGILALLFCGFWFVVLPKLGPGDKSTYVDPKDWRKKADASLPDKERVDWLWVSTAGDPLTFTYVGKRHDETLRADLYFKAEAIVVVNPDNPKEKSMGTYVETINEGEYHQLMSGR